MPPTRVQLTHAQLQWLQEMQQLIDQEMTDREVDPTTSQPKEDSEPQLWVNWNLAYRFQGQLICEAANRKIPEKATPNVYASWNVIRNLLGKGPILYDEAQERSPDTARDEQGSSSSGPGAMSF
ncbi:hypothetical protein PtB15_7B54 [Puccinia triticina]|nr:hypothetical protein PtB15_7B54 [Puccinia triticina]